MKSTFITKLLSFSTVLLLVIAVVSFAPQTHAAITNSVNAIQNTNTSGTTLNPCNNAGNVSPLFAAKLCSNTGTGSEQKVASTIQRIIVTILIIAAVVALIFLIWGGIKWILSGGDKAKVETARNTIIAAIIGLIVAFLAYFILNIVLSFFGLSLGSLTIPSITGQ